MTTELLHPILTALIELGTWTSLRDLRDMVGGRVSPQDNVLRPVRELERSGLVETRGGWKDQFQIRAKTPLAGAQPQIERQA